MLVGRKQERSLSRTQRDRDVGLASPSIACPLVPDLEITAEAARAPEMLRRARQLRSDREARRWLAWRVGDAIVGLLPVAANSGPLAEEALTYLRSLKTEGFAPVLRNHIHALSPAARAKLWSAIIEHGEELPAPFDVSTGPPWLAPYQTKTRSRRPLGREWLFPHRLPELIVGQQRANAALKDRVLRALRASSLKKPHPLITLLRRRAEPASLDAFAWALFDQWDSRDQPARGSWALRTIGLIGSDGSAIRLTHLLEIWLKEARWRIVQLGLDCLFAVETDAALMQVFYLVRKIRSQHWAESVYERLRQTAKRKRLSLEQLSDRSVPALDLDERGQRIFSYGWRSFRVTVCPSLQAQVVDKDGRRVAALPEPNSRDDLSVALPAFDEWFYFRKQLRQVREVQGSALEESMIAGRRWDRHEFQTHFVAHPLMFPLARTLLWGGYNARGKLCCLFRLNEDGAWIDPSERVLVAEQVTMVGIVHPLSLNEEQRQTWGEVFANDELVPPFAQLARPLAHLQASEKRGSSICRFETLRFPALSLLRTVKQLGWQRSQWVYDAHFRAFPQKDVTAIVRYAPGIPEELLGNKAYQSQLRCYFVRGRPVAGELSPVEVSVSLNSVDPAIVSEVLGGLQMLALKGE